jgi:hypothetical protein
MSEVDQRMLADALGVHTPGTETTGGESRDESSPAMHTWISLIKFLLRGACATLGPLFSSLTPAAIVRRPQG